MIISTQGLSKRFGDVVALNDVTCDVAEGATGLLGPNGSGKTTLLRILLGLLPAEGAATVLDLDPTREPFAVRARIGYMPESECIVPGLVGVDVVTFMGRLAGMPHGAARKRAHEVMYFVGLDEERYREATEYSQGMQQRLKLATALVHDPDVLFLDEPTNGLDPGGRVEMLALIRELAREHGKNVFLSSHLLQDVEQVCTDVVMLKEGRVIRVGGIEGMTASDAGAYQVEARGDAAALREALQTEGARLDGEGALLVQLPEGADTSLIFRAARKCGAQVRGLMPTRRTLEDVFLAEVENDAG